MRGVFFAFGFGRPRVQAVLLIWGIWVAVAGTVGATGVEPPGPSSRKSPFVISEIMYHPAALTVVTNGATNQLDTEFLELYNANPFYEDLSGYRITGDITYTFPNGTGLAGLARLVLAKNPEAFQTQYQLTNVTVLGYGVTESVTNIVGGVTNLTTRLINSLSRSGKVRLWNSSGGVIFEVNYDHANPWPVGADGTGHSLVLARPSYGEADPAAWSIGDHVGGTPGYHETAPNEPLRNVVINEILAHTDLPQLDTLELYNHGNTPLDLSGCVLADEAGTNQFSIPNGTTIPPRGFATFDETQLGFALSAAGETVYFWNSNHTRLLDAVQFAAQENGVSFGRHPDGTGDFYRLQSLTLGTNNAPVLVSGVVINELMYAPITGRDSDEYVELYNRTTTAVDLGGWRLEGGISFTLPPNTQLAPDSYLVIAKNLTNLLAKYPQLNATNLLGDYDGTLKNSGERVALSKPETIDVTNLIHLVVDEVSYRAGGQWPTWARGGGSSLERRDAHADGRLAANWADSDETAKAPWTTVAVTGALSLGADSANAIEGGLQGEGECQLDDVQVIYGGSDRVPNSAFDSDRSGWAFRGNHVRTSLDPTNGFGGSQGLCVRASGRCDTGANRLYAPLSTTIPDGSTATIQAKVRWRRGWPEFLLRLHGNYLEAPTRLALPPDLGSPGIANSAATSNAGPAIHHVAHSPVLPVAGQATVVTAQADDPDGLLGLELRYRVDPSPTYTAVTMSDSGTGADAIAGDGIYSAAIPGQAANKLVAFVVTATDDSPNHEASLFPTNTPAASLRPRECLVRFGEPQRASSFGTYHQWFTQAGLDEWINRPVMSNEGIEGTFVYGNFRAIYNFSARYAGSPFHQGWTAPTADCHYSLALPGDDLLLGTDNFNKLHAPGDGPFSDGFLAREQTAHWIGRQLGLPWTYRRFVNMYVNGSLRKSNYLMEDVQVPGDDFLEEYYPTDADGDLRKLNGWLEMGDADSGALSVSLAAWADLNPYQEPAGSGQHKLARYRWTWQPRSYSSSGNDFTNLFRLVDAAALPAGSAYAASLQAEADIEQWLRVWAARHVIGDSDFFGSMNSQNCYAYRPRLGRWQLFSWDMNTAFGVVEGTISYAPGMGLFPPPGTDWSSGPNVTKLLNFPAFRRMYWRAYKELCAGPLAAPNIDPYLDSRYAAFQADGLATTSPDATFSFTDSNSREYGTNVQFSGSIRSYIATARSLILARLAAEDAASFGVDGSPDFTTNHNLVTFTGSAPVEIRTITVNGNAYPITWLTVSTWRMTVPLPAETNVLSFQAWDGSGNLLTNFNSTVTVNYTGTFDPPEGAIVINEILPHPAQPGEAFVELFNRATNAFDLSGWRLNGLGFTFPPGAILGPLGYLVLARDYQAYTSAFGLSHPPDGIFEGSLDPDGETLTLLRPGLMPGTEIVVDRVRYEAAAPWPTGSTGVSLQLVDATQDNSRVANWRVAVTNDPALLSWVFCTGTGIPRNVASGTRPLLIYLQSAGDIYVDDVSVVAGAEPGVGVNLVTNGSFETTLSPWTIGTAGNNSASVVSPNYAHSGTNSLHLVAATGGSTQNTSIWQDFTSRLTVNGTYTLSFWYRQSTNGGPLTVRFSSSGITITTNPAPAALTLARATPGAVNSVATPLAPLPPLWLNEVQPDPATKPLDNFNEPEPWAEIFNPDTNACSLAGYYLTDTYTNLTKWAFPATAVVDAGHFARIWCDGQTNQAAPDALHADLRLARGPGNLALTRLVNGTPQIVDYLNFPALLTNWSYGDFPDGQPFYRRTMFAPTPAAPNTNTSPPLTVFINEWLADNATVLADPADGHFEDWFEIYNPGPDPADLGGYYLTDTLTNKFQFLVPTNGHYVIPPGGFLLVWADNEPGQNATNRADLHASFALSKGGEAIGLFAPDGTAIDAVTFGPQTTDHGQGRFPDGASGVFSMSTSTPRAGNMIANTAPAFVLIADRFTYAGLTVRHTVEATDAQSAVQRLSFSLLASPAEATIDPANGEFVWPVPGPWPPGTNLVMLRVMDNGTPPLSGDASFAVIVLPPPQLTAALAGDQLEIRWPATELGWRLEAQTNSLATGLTPDWFEVADSTTTNQIFLPISPANDAVFLRLVHP